MKFVIVKSGNGVDGRIIGLTKPIRNVLGWESKDCLRARIEDVNGVKVLVLNKEDDA